MVAAATSFGARLARDLPGLEELHLSFAWVEDVMELQEKEYDIQPKWVPFEVGSVLTHLTALCNLREIKLEKVWLCDRDMAVVAKLSNLQVLSLSLAQMMNPPKDGYTRELLTSVGFSELANLPLLTTLSLQDMDGSVGAAEVDGASFKELGELPSLTSLSVGGDLIWEDDHLDNLFAGSVCSQLQSLSLSSGAQFPSVVGATGLTYLADTAALCALEDLSLHWDTRFAFFNDALKEWKEDLAACDGSLRFPTSPKSLQLAEFPLYAEDMDKAKLPPDLESLVLHNFYKVNSGSLTSLLALPNLSTLVLHEDSHPIASPVDLNVSYYNLGDGLNGGLTALTTLSIALRAMDCATLGAVPSTVRLLHCRLHSGGMRDIEMVKLPSSVEELSIDIAPVIDDCELYMALLANLVANQTGLEALTLTFQGFDNNPPDGAEYLIPALQELPRLRRVDFPLLRSRFPALYRRLELGISTEHQNNPLVTSRKPQWEENLWQLVRRVATVQ